MHVLIKLNALALCVVALLAAIEILYDMYYALDSTIILARTPALSQYS